MSNDLYKQVNFSDGEGLTFGDLNDIQKYAESKVWEQVIHNQIGAMDVTVSPRDPQFGGQDGANHPSSRAYCLNPGAAYLRIGSTTSKIQVAPGTLLQKIGTLTGTTPQILAYTFAGTEEWQLVNGDATNPRCDLLQMSLAYATSDSQSRDFEDATTRIVTSAATNKKNQVVCTLSVKQGVAAASPQIPEPDAGCVPVAVAVIAAGWVTGTGATSSAFNSDSTAVTPVTIYDVRMPIGMRAYTVDPKNYRVGAAWNIASDNLSYSATSGTNSLYIPLPFSSGRLIAIGITHDDTTQSLTGVSVGQMDVASGGTSLAGYSSKNNVTIALHNPSMIEEVVNQETWEASHTPSGGATVLQSATTKIGVPLWLTGGRCAQERNRLPLTYTRKKTLLWVKITNSTFGAGSSFVGPITFFVAEGI